MARNRDALLRSVREVMFFGVPNQGMEISHLRPLIKGQPTDCFVSQLARGSAYLQNLDRQFAGLSTYMKNLHSSTPARLVSFYETRQSETAEVCWNVWIRVDTVSNGPNSTTLRHLNGITQAREQFSLLLSLQFRPDQMSRTDILSMTHIQTWLNLHQAIRFMRLLDGMLLNRFKLRPRVLRIRVQPLNPAGAWLQS